MCKVYSLLEGTADYSSAQLDLTIRQQILDFARILYDEKDSYMVTLKLPKKKKAFVCHSLGKVIHRFITEANDRGGLSCVGSILESSHLNGELLLLLGLRQPPQWHRRL